MEKLTYEEISRRKVQLPNFDYLVNFYRSDLDEAEELIEYVQGTLFSKGTWYGRGIVTSVPDQGKPSKDSRFLKFNNEKMDESDFYHYINLEELKRVKVLVDYKAVPPKPFMTFPNMTEEERLQRHLDRFPFVDVNPNVFYKTQRKDLRELLEVLEITPNKQEPKGLFQATQNELGESDQLSDEVDVSYGLVAEFAKLLDHDTANPNEPKIKAFDTAFPEFMFLNVNAFSRRFPMDKLNDLSKELFGNDQVFQIAEESAERIGRPDLIGKSLFLMEGYEVILHKLGPGPMGEIATVLEIVETPNRKFKL